MRRPNDDDEALALSTSFDRRPPTTRKLELVDPVVSTDTAATADGVRLALKRYMPRTWPPTSPGGRNPVILCHGLAGNAAPFDLRKHDSLSWALVEQGHPVWLVNLRGAGGSDRPMGGWTLNDYIQYDVPAVIQHVLQADGGAGGAGKKVHWVGHSLGGIVILCALATVPSLQPHVQSVTTLGSALDYEESAWKRFAPLVPMSRLIPNGDRVVLPEGLTPALLALIAAFPHILCAEKVNKETLAALEQSMEPVALGVMQHLGTAIQPGGLALHPPTQTATAAAAAAADAALKSTSGVDSPRAAGADTLPIASPRQPHQQPQPQQPQRYLQIMGRVRVPVLALCGDRDLQCPEKAVLRMLEALGSTRRRFVLVGGGGEDGRPSYGHMDLLLKESAVVGVWPYVCQWIASAEAGGWGADEEVERNEAEAEGEEIKAGESGEG